jgi:Domain of unknown function (DUF4123)
VDLVALDARDQAEYMELAQTQVRQQEASVCSLMLASEQSAPDLARHLSIRIVVRLQPGGPPKLFRFFDPGTFVQMPGLLGDNGMDWLLGPVSSALVPWAGEWQIVEKRASAAGFRLSAEHLQEMMRMGATNRVAAQREPPSNQQVWIDRCHAIAGHVRRAHVEHGLTLQADQVAFATHAMQHHARFDEHPALTQLFATLGRAQPEDELDYIELTGRITAPQWALIASELNASGATSAPKEGTVL